MKNVFLSFYRNIFLCQYRKQKCLVCNGPNNEQKLDCFKIRKNRDKQFILKCHFQELI